MQNPFNGEEDPVVLLPALNPDVALLHAQYVGEDGTVRIKGLTFADVEQAKSADSVIVSCEEIVPIEFIRMDPDQNSLPPFLVDAIVKFPYGATRRLVPISTIMMSPTSIYIRMRQKTICVSRYLDEWVLGVSNHEAYLQKVGVGNLVKIKANPVMGYAPGLDRR